MPSSKMPTAAGACVRLATTNAISGRRIPTKTTSPSRISRAACATISSPRESSGTKGRPARAEPAQVRGAVRNVRHPFAQPRVEAGHRPRPAVVLVEEVVVAAVAALERGGMRRARLDDDGDRFGRRDDRPVRLSTDRIAVDELVRYDDDAAGRERRLLGDPPRPPELRVPVGVRALRDQDRDVGADRGDKYDRIAAEGIVRAAEGRVRREDLAAEERARRDVRRAQGAREERQSDGEVAVVLDGDPPRDPLLRRAAVAVREPGGHVADPRRHDLRYAPRADELVEEDVRDRADEREVAPTLTDQLVTGTEWDRRLERATHRDGRTVGHEARDRLAHGHDLGHADERYRRARCGPRYLFVGVGVGGAGNFTGGAGSVNASSWSLPRARSSMRASTPCAFHSWYAGTPF